MRVLLTGASGFVGRYVIGEFVKLGHEVVACYHDTPVDKMQGVIPQKHDLTDESARDLFAEFGQPAMLVHLAWPDLPRYKDQVHYERNLWSSYRFIKNLVEHGLKRVVVLGTCAEYGLQQGCLQEDLPVSPVTAYGLAKATLHQFLRELQKTHAFTLTWIRLFYVYGKGQKSSLTAKLDDALASKADSFDMSGGEQLRDFIPVETAANYITRLSLQTKEQGVVNCCSGQPVSVRRFVENYLEQKSAKLSLNLALPYPDYEPMAFWGSRVKLDRWLEHQP